MLLNLFNEMRAAKVPVSVRELLDLINALKHNVVFADMDEFYYLARAILVKDERHFDKFDRAFGAYFKGIEAVFDTSKGEIPLDWLIKRMERELTPEQKAALEKFGYDKLMDRLNELLKEQKERHEGGNKWIGTGGTSPFGHGGTNPEGIRIGGQGRNRTAVKVWDQRSYKDYDDERELGTRNIKVALRRLRKFARQGAAEELDLDGTIIPISGINNVLSGIPLVGDILTGGGSGILAATYTIKGPKSKPEVFVNPLSVLAPGILRKIFFE